MWRRLFNCFRSEPVDAIAYRRAYRKAKQKAKEEARTIISHAQLDAESTRLAGMEDAEFYKRQAREEADAIRQEAERKGHASGQKNGFRKGKSEGMEVGQKEGRELAYNEECRRLGILTPRPLEQAASFGDETLHWGPHANVYQGRDKWIVRMIINGQRVKQEFQFKMDRKEEQDPTRRYRRMIIVYRPNPASAKEALIKALRYRQTLLPPETSAGASPANSAMVAEIVQDLLGGELSGRMFSLLDVARIAEEFHRRIQTDHRVTLHSVSFLGDDPEDRLDIEDKRILTAPWTQLFEGKIPQRFVDAFSELGLGTSSGPRTVRDMLLITPHELRKCTGIGAKSLQHFREALRDNGLVLWGDEPPPPPMDVGERHFRAIHLD